MKLQNNILATVAYYDIFDFPLKAEEVFDRLVNFRHLGKEQAENLIISKELDQLVLDGIIESREGYYFLRGREYLVPLRLKREKLAGRKWRITRRAVWLLRFVPYVRTVFASGSLAINNTGELSDLDVLVVIKNKRIWLGRIWISAVLSLFRLRRRAFDRIAPDKICLNHYITDASFLIPFRSIYNAQTYSNLVPIYLSEPGLIDKFQKDNSWVLDYVFHWNFNSKTILNPGLAGLCGKFWELVLGGRVGDWLEKLVGNYQFKRIAKNPLTSQSGGRIIFSNNQLEFHPDSIEKEVITKYNRALVVLGLGDLAKEKDSGLNR